MPNRRWMDVLELSGLVDEARAADDQIRKSRLKYSPAAGMAAPKLRRKSPPPVSGE